MTDKQLVSKLNNLKSVNPDAKWLESNRELLLTQISNSGAVEISTRSSFVINIQSFMKTATQPAFAMAVFVCLLVTGSLFSHQLFNKTQPNDSLYIARIISEKAKLNTIFSNEDRDKMAVQFASNHAQEITSILADPEFNHEDEVAVARLSKDFKKEMSVVKTRMNYTVVAPETAVTSDDEVVVMANNDKGDARLEIYEGEEASVPGNTGEAEVVVAEEATEEESDEEVVLEEEVVEEITPDQILQEAEELFEQKDYEDALNKLKEINSIIE